MLLCHLWWAASSLFISAVVTGHSCEPYKGVDNISNSCRTLLLDLFHCFCAAIYNVKMYFVYHVWFTCILCCDVDRRLTAVRLQPFICQHILSHHCLCSQQQQIRSLALLHFHLCTHRHRCFHWTDCRASCFHHISRWMVPARHWSTQQDCWVRWLHICRRPSAGWTKWLPPFLLTVAVVVSFMAVLAAALACSQLGARVVFLHSVTVAVCVLRATLWFWHILYSTCSQQLVSTCLCTLFYCMVTHVNGA